MMKTAVGSAMMTRPEELYDDEDSCWISDDDKT